MTSGGGLPIMLLILAAAFAVGVVWLICWIMALVKIFHDNVGLGILGIFCAPFAFIYGWVKVREHNSQTLMTVWTVASVLGCLSLGLAMVASFGYSGFSGLSGQTNEPGLM